MVTLKAMSVQVGRLLLCGVVAGTMAGLAGCAQSRDMGPFAGPNWNGLLGTGDTVRVIRDRFLQSMYELKLTPNDPQVADALRNLSRAISEVESASPKGEKVHEELRLFATKAIEIFRKRGEGTGEKERCYNDYLANIRMCNSEPVCMDRAVKQLAKCLEGAGGGTTKVIGEAATLELNTDVVADSVVQKAQTFAQQPAPAAD